MAEFSAGRVDMRQLMTAVLYLDWRNNACGQPAVPCLRTGPRATRAKRLVEPVSAVFSSGPNPAPAQPAPGPGGALPWTGEDGALPAIADDFSRDPRGGLQFQQCVPGMWPIVTATAAKHHPGEFSSDSPQGSRPICASWT